MQEEEKVEYQNTYKLEEEENEKFKSHIVYEATQQVVVVVVVVVVVARALNKRSKITS